VKDIEIEERGNVLAYDDGSGALNLQNEFGNNLGARDVKKRNIFNEFQYHKACRF
jgi:hypothetical protein